MGICLVALSGCSGEAPSTPAGPGPATTPGGGAAMAVQILPEKPTTSSNLRAVVRNVGRIDSFRWKRDGALISGVSGDKLPGRYFEKGNLITVTVTSGDQTANAETVIVNTPPEVVSADFADSRIHGGAEISVIPEGKDIDGDPVHFRYVWTVDGQEDSWNDSGTLAGDQVRKGARISLRIIPFDGQDEGLAFQTTEFSVPNSPPGFVTRPPDSFEEDRYIYKARAEDPDGDQVTYSLVAAPPGMNIDSSTGDILWQVTREDAGNHDVRIEAEDEEGLKAIQAFSVIFRFPE